MCVFAVYNVSNSPQYGAPTFHSVPSWSTVLTRTGRSTKEARMTVSAHAFRDSLWPASRQNLLSEPCLWAARHELFCAAVTSPSRGPLWHRRALPTHVCFQSGCVGGGRKSGVSFVLIESSSPGMLASCVGDHARTAREERYEMPGAVFPRAQLAP